MVLFRAITLLPVCLPPSADQLHCYTTLRHAMATHRMSLHPDDYQQFINAIELLLNDHLYIFIPLNLTKIIQSKNVFKKVLKVKPSTFSVYFTSLDDARTCFQKK